VAIRVQSMGSDASVEGFCARHCPNPTSTSWPVNDLTSPESTPTSCGTTRHTGSLDVPRGDHNDGMTVGSKTIKVLAERSPAELPWGELNVDVVIESTGRFTHARERWPAPQRGSEKGHHLGPGDRRRRHVRDRRQRRPYDPAQHHVVSNASCTTNCFVPMVKVLDDAFGVTNRLMTTIHAYTNDQNLLDLEHKDLRRARAAAINIVPSSTGAARATSLVLASMKGRLDGTSLRSRCRSAASPTSRRSSPCASVDAVKPRPFAPPAKVR